MNINDIIGTPYRELDCYALVCKVSREYFGIALPEVADYSKDPASVVRAERSMYGWVELAGPESGAVALLGTYQGDARHVGICLPDGQVLHTCHRYGALIQNYSQLSLAGYVHRTFYAWRGE